MSVWRTLRDLLQVLPARRDAERGDRAPPPDPVADERVVCASGFDPADGGRAGLEGAARAVREAVADALPFLDRHLVAESAPPLVAPGRAEPPAAHSLCAFDDAEPLGLAGLPVRGPWKNLFLAGREVVPGLGVEGEFHAGIQDAAHVSALLGRKGVLG